MGTVEAAQLIYGNVEKDRSPSGRGGFQTLFYSRAALTDTDAEEVESRLVYYSGTTAPVKRLFFAIPTGRLVVAQVVSLPEPDRSGRLGRYLAHALVFPPGALNAADIFAVFATFAFVTTVEDALTRGEFPTGDIRLATWSTPPTSATEPLVGAAHWPPDELEKLARLTLGANALAQERSIVAVVGLPDEVEQALPVALFFVPSGLLPHCSFDTWFYRCNPAAVHYWAVGLPEPPSGPQYLVVDAHHRRVSGTLPALPANSYQNWIAAMIARQQIEWIAEQKEVAFALCQWLDSHEPAPTALGELSPELIGSVVEANSSAVRTRLQARLDRQLSPVLTPHLLDRLYASTEPRGLLRGLQAGFDHQRLVALLYERYASQRFAAPPAAEQRALAAVLAGAEPCRLGLLLAAWARDLRQLGQQLAALNQAEYREFVSAALRWRFVAPLLLLGPERGDIFLDVFLASPGSADADLPELTRRLLETGQSDLLDRLIPLVDGQSPKALERLARMPDQRREVSENFWQAVEGALARQPKRLGLMARLRTLLGQRPPEEPQPSSTREALAEEEGHLHSRRWRSERGSGEARNGGNREPPKDPR